MEGLGRAVGGLAPPDADSRFHGLLTALKGRLRRSFRPAAENISGAGRNRLPKRRNFVLAEPQEAALFETEIIAISNADSTKRDILSTFATLAD